MRNQADREVSVAIDRHPLRAFAAVVALAALAGTGCGTEIPDDGTADGDALTFPVRCRPGTRRCTGQQPQTCNASGFWQNDGAACGVCNVCTPTSVRCLTATNGTACNDGNACTRADSCQGGACVGSNPVVCPAAPMCKVAGTCNPSTGVCATPTNATNGTACNDGNACTQTDTCANGLCVGGNPLICPAGTCNASTGTCS